MERLKLAEASAVLATRLFAWAAGGAVLLAAMLGTGMAGHALGHSGFESKPPVLVSNIVALLDAPS